MGHSKHWSAPVTAGAAMLALALSVALESAPATADTVHGQAGRVEAENVDAFYDTTDLGVPAGVLTGSVPGQVFRTQAALYTPQLAGLDAGPLAAVPATATKILYASTDQWGVPVPVSGYVVEPRVPWTGPGPRPTVVVGRGTVGQGDQCAPSRNWPLDGQPDPLPSGRNSNLEGLYDLVFAAQGIRVVVTDYIGMGTPGVHTFMNRLDQAHAMIDAARAVRSLVEHAGEGTDAPVGPGANDTVCGCGHCIDPGLDEHWWRERQSSLYDSGAVMVETDGDRISVFFPQLPGTVLDRAAVIGRCCSAGMVRDTLRLFDREDREVFTGLRLIGQEEPEEQDAAA